MLIEYNFEQNLMSMTRFHGLKIRNFIRYHLGFIDLWYNNIFFFVKSQIWIWTRVWEKIHPIRIQSVDNPKLATSRSIFCHIFLVLRSWSSPFFKECGGSSSKITPGDACTITCSDPVEFLAESLPLVVDVWCRCEDSESAWKCDEKTGHSSHVTDQTYRAIPKFCSLESPPALCRCPPVCDFCPSSPLDVSTGLREALWSLPWGSTVVVHMNAATLAADRSDKEKQQFLGENKRCRRQPWMDSSLVVKHEP